MTFFKIKRGQNFSSFLSELSEATLYKRIIFVSIVWAILYLTAISTIEIDKSDTRRIYPALKMIETENYLIPEYGGETYFRKPPMFNWMIALSVKCFGANDIAVRLPSRLSLLFFSILILCCPSGFIDRRARLLFSLIFFSSIGILEVGRNIEIDASYIAFTAAAILLWLNFYSLDKKAFLLWLPPAICLGIALLLKGPLALFFFYFTIIIVLNSDKKISELFSIYHLFSLGIVLGIFFGWYLLAKMQMPVDAGSEKITKTWSEEILYRLNPANMRIKIWIRGVLGAFLGFLPWLIFFPQIFKTSISAKKDTDKENTFSSRIKPQIFKAAVCLFVIVNLMPGVKARYSMPVYSLVAILASVELSEKKQKIHHLFKQIIRYTLLCLSFISAACLALFISLRLILQQGIALGIPEKLSKTINGIGSLGILLMLIACICPLLGLLIKVHHDAPQEKGFDFRFGSLLWLTLSVSLFLYAFIYPIFQSREKGRAFATQIENLIGDKAILGVDQDISTETFLFYLKIPYKIASKNNLYQTNFTHIIIEENENNKSFQNANYQKLKYGKKNYTLIKIE